MVRCERKQVERRTTDYALADLEAAIDRLAGLRMTLPQIDCYAWNMARGRNLLMVKLREAKERHEIGSEPEDAA